jgi:Amt family ammonium transporter
MSIATCLGMQQLWPTPPVLPGAAPQQEWLLLASVLVFFVLAGFALIETGLGRAKNAANTMTMNFLVYGLTLCAFFFVGFALMCGGSGKLQVAALIHYNLPLPGLDRLATVPLGGGHGVWGLFGFRGFFLGATGGTILYAWFFFMAVCTAVAVTIPIGSLVERWRFKSFFLFTLICAGIIVPIYGCWVWGGGWLAALGINLHLGHGVVDYAGASVIHLLGGGMAWVMLKQIGPRIGKYEMDGTPRPIFGHHVPMVLLGTFVLTVGFFGLTLGQSFAAGDGRAALVAVNTAIASSAAALAALLYMWNIYGKPDPSLLCNGMVAGLVAISGAAAFVQPWAAFFIGAIGGVVAVAGVLYFERRGVDDPVGAISVHGIGGAWGMLAVGLFASNTFGEGYNGVSGYVAGLLYGDVRQFVAQLIGIAVCAIWSMTMAFIAFAILQRILHTNRASPEVEMVGLDVPEMGASGYPEFISRMGGEDLWH